MNICEVCDKKFKPTRNSKGIYCSIQCAGVGNRIIKEAYCLECKKAFMPRAGSQKFCKQSCSATYNNKAGAFPKRTVQGTCDKCGSVGVRAGRKYCASCNDARKKLCACGRKMMAESIHETCSRCRKAETSQRAKDRKREREGKPPRVPNPQLPSVDEWLLREWNGADRNGLLNTRVRRYLIEQAEHRCQSPTCDVPGGFRTVHPTTGRVPVEIEHINGDSTDHRPENLIVLCPNCHALTPTYRALNKNSKRSWRRKTVDEVDTRTVT